MLFLPGARPQNLMVSEESPFTKLLPSRQFLP